MRGQEELKVSHSKLLIFTFFVFTSILKEPFPVLAKHLFQFLQYWQGTFSSIGKAAFPELAKHLFQYWQSTFPVLAKHLFQFSQYWRRTFSSFPSTGNALVKQLLGKEALSVLSKKRLSCLSLYLNFCCATFKISNPKFHYFGYLEEIIEGIL